MRQERLTSLDIAKGILIILVVIAHLPGELRNEIYYFHMPAFFVISGVFLPSTEKLNKDFLTKRLRSFGIPYLVYLVVIGLTYHGINETEVDYGILKLLIGGRALYGPLGPFWFISALFFSLVGYFFIERYVKNRSAKIVLIIFLYLLAHLEAWFFSSESSLFYVPFAADVSLLIIPYLYIGKLLKRAFRKIEGDRKVTFTVAILSTFLASSVIMANRSKIFHFQLDMKYVLYENPFLDLLIPLTFLFCIVSLSAILSNVWLGKVFENFGHASLVIMYLHLPVIYLVGRSNSTLVLIVAGCLIPLLLFLIFKRNSFTAKVFLGK